MLSIDDQALAMALVGDTPDGALGKQIEAIAARYTYDAMYPGFGLELLYVERDLLKVAYGWCWQQVQFTAVGDATVALQQQAQALAIRMRAIEVEIADRWAQARASVAGISTGVLSTKAPTSPPWPAPYPDANAPVYQGSAYYRPYRPQGS